MGSFNLSSGHVTDLVMNDHSSMNGPLASCIHFAFESMGFLDRIQNCNSTELLRKFRGSSDKVYNLVLSCKVP